MTLFETEGSLAPHLLPMNTETQAAIERLCEQGNEAEENGDYPRAFSLFQEALELVPEPLDQWWEATWLLTALGDTCITLGNYEEARKYLSEAMACPDAIGNAFIHLRLGQAEFEMGDMKRAGDELMRAYMGGGPKIFEEEDPKYLAYLATIADDIQVPE